VFVVVFNLMLSLGGTGGAVSLLVDALNNTN
jgi:hypothetical protein